MKIASRNTAPKHTFARGSATMSRKFAITAARLNGGGFGSVVLRNAKKAVSATASENAPSRPNTARQPMRSPMMPAIEAPSTLAVSAMPRSRAIAT